MKTTLQIMVWTITSLILTLWLPNISQAKAQPRTNTKRMAQAAPTTTPPAKTDAAPKTTPSPATDTKVSPQTGTSAQNPKTMDQHRFTLIDVEEKVNTLKENVFRSKAQLLLLQETLLQGVISTSKITIIHEDKIGSSFYLMSAAYSLDGTPIFSRSDQNGNLNTKKTFDLFTGSIRPGPHRLSVELRYRGNGFGIFSYLNSYRFRIRSSYAFTIQEGKAVTIQVQPYQLNWTHPLEKRLQIQYNVKMNDLSVRRKKLQDVLTNKPQP